MFKNIIAPVQAWLLSQGRCVGCGSPLRKGKIAQKLASSVVEGSKTEELVACKCGRVYVLDSKTVKYRRALLSEV